VYFIPVGKANPDSLLKRVNRWHESQLNRGFPKSALKEDGSEVGPPEFKVKDVNREVEIGGDSRGGSSRRTTSSSSSSSSSSGSKKAASSSGGDDDDEDDRVLLAAGLNPSALSAGYMAGVDSSPVLPPGTLLTDAPSPMDYTSGVCTVGESLYVLSANGKSVNTSLVKAVGSGSSSFTPDQWEESNSDGASNSKSDPELAKQIAEAEVAGAQARTSMRSTLLEDAEVGTGIAAIGDRLFVRVIPADSGAAALGSSMSAGSALQDAAAAPIRIAVFDRKSMDRIGTVTVESGNACGGVGLIADGSILYIPVVLASSQDDANAKASEADQSMSPGSGLPMLLVLDPFGDDVRGGRGNVKVAAASAHSLGSAQTLIGDGLTAHQALMRLSFLCDGRVVLSADRESKKTTIPPSEGEDEPQVLTGYRVFGERLSLTLPKDIKPSEARISTVLPSKGQTEDHVLPAVRPDALAFDASTGVILVLDAGNSRIGVIVNPATPRQHPVAVSLAADGF